MNNSKPTSSLEVGAGQVRITDETIQIDIGPFGALKRLYEQSKLIVAVFIGSLLFQIVSYVLDPFPLAREIGQFVIVVAVITFPLLVILPRLRNNIGTETELHHSAIDHVEYTTGSRFRAPKLRFIVTYGKVTGIRPVPLSHRQHGGDEQLEEAIQAFEEAGISIVPDDDTIDDDS